MPPWRLSRLVRATLPGAELGVPSVEFWRESFFRRLFGECGDKLS
jgi:hypothetical protein